MLMTVATTAQEVVDLKVQLFPRNLHSVMDGSCEFVLK